jgi:hypothetical protein
MIRILLKTVKKSKHTQSITKDMKLLISSVAIATLSLFIYAKPISKKAYVTSHKEASSTYKPIVVKVDFTTTFTVGGTTCTDHVTGTITLEFQLGMFVDIIDQHLSHQIKCGNKPSQEARVNSMAWDRELGAFTGSVWDPTGDEDIDALVVTDDFQKPFLETVNTQVKEQGIE